MKLNNKDSTKEMSSQRDKSIDLKEKSKQEKLQKEKEKKEKERLEKERKEREKRLEKEKKEREKLNKKGGGGGANILSAAATSSDLNRIDKSNNNSQLTNSKSENMLTKLRKQTSLLSSSTSTSNQTKQKEKNNKQISQSQIDQQPLLPKGRFRCQVVYLDESVKTFDLDKNAIGDDLFTKVSEDLELVEKEYFSLTYRDYNNMKFWLDHEKKIKTQLKGIIDTNEPVFNFEVKFYPPEPKFLQEEITRYLLTLQLRHDIMDGKLPCTFVTHALLGSFTVQAELGDYDEINNGINRSDGFANFDYLEGFCFAPNQTTELLAAIADCHKDHKGQSPAEAEMHYLENAVKLAMYGVDLHNAKDSDGVDILIGVSASGLLVFRDHLRINRFAWPKILKISYKRNHFYLKLRPGEFEKYETTIGFRCPNHKAAKRLWKIAVEHHSFFRLREPEKPKSSRILIPNFNQKFRYTGSSTYMQSRNRSIDRNQPQFTRSLSKRLTQSMDRGLAGQNPNETPGSVQSAAFNHFNRIKQHQSISNLPNRNNLNEFRESQEDLELGGDYNVNDNLNDPNYLDDEQNFDQNMYNNNNKNQINRVQPTSNNYVNNPNRSPGNAANFSNRTNNDSYAVKSNTLPNFGNQNLNQEQDSFDQLDEYYTSVDKNYPNDSNRNPSMISNTNSQKISTPIISQDSRQQPSQQQSSNRYVPSRPFNQQAQYDQENQYPLPVSPRSNLPNNSQTNFQNQLSNQQNEQVLLNDDSVFLPYTPKSEKLFDKNSTLNYDKKDLSKSNILTTQYPSKNDSQSLNYASVESLGNKSQYNVNNILNDNNKSKLLVNSKKTDNTDNIKTNDILDKKSKVIMDQPLSLKVNVKSTPVYNSKSNNLDKISVSERTNEDGTGYTRSYNKISISKNDDEYVEKYEHRRDEFEEKVINTSSNNIDDSFNKNSSSNNNSIHESTVSKHIKTYERNIIVSVAVRY